MVRIGRNQHCPCGSEKKYKKCCLNKNRDKHTLDLGRDNELLNTEAMLSKVKNDPLFKDTKITLKSTPGLPPLSECMFEIANPLIESFSVMTQPILERIGLITSVVWNASRMPKNDSNEDPRIMIEKLISSRPESLSR